MHMVKKVIKGSFPISKVLVFSNSLRGKNATILFETNVIKELFFY